MTHLGHQIYEIVLKSSTIKHALDVMWSSCSFINFNDGTCGAGENSSRQAHRVLLGLAAFHFQGLFPQPVGNFEDTANMSYAFLQMGCFLIFGKNTLQKEQ